MPQFDAGDAERDEVWAVVQLAFLRRPLAALLGACRADALELIVLKGAALAETVYSRPSLRPYGDIDVLVRPGDAPRAYALLLGLGYVTDLDAWADLLAGRSCEANFFQNTERGSVVVELHTDLLNNGLLRGQVSLDLGGLWERSCLVILAGTEARVLGPEDQILHLCLHLAGHYFDAPRSVRDIVQVRAVRTVDWPLFASQCRDTGTEAIGYAGLRAAVSAGASVPADVLDCLAPRALRRALDLLLAVPPPLSDLQRFRLFWLLLGSAGARRRAMRGLLFPERAWLHRHYFYVLPEPPAHLLGLRLYGRHLRFLIGTLIGALARRGRRTPPEG